MWFIKSLFLTCFVFSDAAPGDEIVVNTPDGQLVGLERVTGNLNIPVWTFYGIPYAAPPVGSLRFQPPQQVHPWTGIRNATYFRSVCTQSNASSDVFGSEDCLHINIYTINKPGNQALVPVMVYIHGGAYTIETGNKNLNMFEEFLENGVVFVSLNYRLGIFGFLCTKDSASPGNYGIKDQIAALKWINKNIALFGGDPSKVTLFGQSAGAASIQFIMQQKTTQGLYRGAISDSGSTLNTWAEATNPISLAFKTGIKNLIFTKNTQILVNRLRKVNYKILQKSSVVRPYSFNGLPWAPCIENDVEGAVVTSYSYVKQESGDFVQVPFLTGFNSQEAKLISSSSRFLKALQFSLVPGTMVPKDMNAVKVKTVADLINQFYYNNAIIKVKNDTMITQFASDCLFIRGIRKSSQLLSQYVPVYLYEFDFIGGSAHAALSKGDATSPGTAHSEELYMFFQPQITETAKLVQKRMLKLWTNFVKTGNPTPTLDPIIGTIWPTVNSTGDGNVNYFIIDSNLSVAQNPEKTQMDFWDNLYTQYGYPPYNTY